MGAIGPCLCRSRSGVPRRWIATGSTGLLFWGQWHFSRRLNSIYWRRGWNLRFAKIFFWALWAPEPSPRLDQGPLDHCLSQALSQPRECAWRAPRRLVGASSLAFYGASCGGLRRSSCGAFVSGLQIIRRWSPTFPENDSNCSSNV